MDESSFANEEAPRDPRTLVVVLRYMRKRDVLFVAPKTRAWGENNAMLEGEVADFDRMEQFWDSFARHRVRPEKFCKRLV